MDIPLLPSNCFVLRVRYEQYCEDAMLEPTLSGSCGGSTSGDRAMLRSKIVYPLGGCTIPDGLFGRRDPDPTVGVAGCIATNSVLICESSDSRECLEPTLYIPIDGRPGIELYALEAYADFLWHELARGAKGIEIVWLHVPGTNYITGDWPGILHRYPTRSMAAGFVYAPACSGKTTFCQTSSNYIDIDELYAHCAPQLKLLRRDASRTNNWLQYRIEEDEAIREGFERLRRGNYVIFCHHPDQRKSFSHCTQPDAREVFVVPSEDTLRIRRETAKCTKFRAEMQRLNLVELHRIIADRDDDDLVVCDHFNPFEIAALNHGVPSGILGNGSVLRPIAIRALRGRGVSHTFRECALTFTERVGDAPIRKYFVRLE